MREQLSCTLGRKDDIALRCHGEGYQKKGKKVAVTSFTSLKSAKKNSNPVPGNCMRTGPCSVTWWLTRTSWLAVESKCWKQFSPRRGLHLAPEQDFAELSCTILPSSAQKKEVTAPAIFFDHITLWTYQVPPFKSQHWEHKGLSYSY